MLFTLPGSPVLYYGDEIQMGDNLYLGDRDSVRTPMQWTPDRNGGFSRADFAQLYLPPLMDPVYGFSAVNVEAQQRNPSSFLHWMRRILAVRREFPVLGTGELRGGVVGQPVGAGLRAIRPPDRPEPGAGQPGAVRAQPEPAGPAGRAVTSSGGSGRQPIELLGRVAFPLIGTEPYPVTLGPYGSLCFELA